MVKAPRWKVVLAGAASLVAAWLLLRPSPVAPPARAPSGARRGRTVTTGRDEIPRIDLARLDALGRLEKVEAPGRDPSAVVTPPPPPPPSAVVETAPMVVAAPAGPPPPPPLNMTYLGNLESQAGLKVAVFLTDKKIILSGREGEIVGSRVRVVKIGLESVDVEDLSSGRNQRLALPKKGGGEAAKSGGAEAAKKAGRDKEPGGNSR